jgi:hypothetical protein
MSDLYIFSPLLPEDVKWVNKLKLYKKLHNKNPNFYNSCYGCIYYNQGRRREEPCPDGRLVYKGLTGTYHRLSLNKQVKAIDMVVSGFRCIEWIKYV